MTVCPLAVCWRNWFRMIYAGATSAGRKNFAGPRMIVRRGFFGASLGLCRRLSRRGMHSAGQQDVGEALQPRRLPCPVQSAGRA